MDTSSAPTIEEREQPAAVPAQPAGPLDDGAVVVSNASSGAPPDERPSVLTQSGPSFGDVVKGSSSSVVTTTEAKAESSSNGKVSGGGGGGGNGEEEGKNESAIVEGDGAELSKKTTTTSVFPDPDINAPSLVETVSWWSEFTSVHGVYYAFERGHFRSWKNVAWRVVTAACTVGLVLVLVAEMEQFYEYSVNTSAGTVVPASLPFPQVTICNTNMYDSSLQAETGITDPRNETELIAISQPAEEFILYTSFDGRGYGNLTQVWTPVITPFGRCFNFIADEKVFDPGALSALSVYLWLNQSNYDRDTGTAGVLVFVTERGSTITDQTSPVLVPPGASSFVAVGLFKYHRETEGPWKRCFGKTPLYSNELCRAECTNAATRDRCGCRPIGDDEGRDLPYCTPGDAPCQDKAGDQALAGCDCAAPPCEEEVYVTRYSAARVARKAAERLEVDLRLPSGQFSQNFVHVSVNYDSIRNDDETESKATSITQLISNLGGNMGFFMGLSMISVVEIFGELLCLRIIPRLWGDERLYGVGQKKMTNLQTSAAR